MHNCYPHEQCICKALNNSSALHDTETMCCEHAPVELSKPHALDEEEYDAGMMQDQQQKTDMPPLLNDAALVSGQSERRMQDKTTQSTSIYWGGGKSRKQRQTEEDNEIYLPFSTTNEWLSNDQIMHCTLYLLHMHCATAADQNMTGVNHSVVPREELLFEIREATGQVPNTSQCDIAGTLRKTLSTDGPSPAIDVGGDIHWQIILTDARSQTVAFVNPFGSGFLRDIIAAIKTFYDNEQPGRWQYKKWTTRLQHMKLWYMGNTDTRNMDAILEPK